MQELLEDARAETKCLVNPMAHTYGLKQRVVGKCGTNKMYMR